MEEFIMTTTTLINQSITEVTTAMNMEAALVSKLESIVRITTNETVSGGYGHIDFQGSRVNEIVFDAKGMERDISKENMESTVYFIVARQVKAFYEIETFGYYSKLDLLNGNTNNTSQDDFENNITNFAFNMVKEREAQYTA